MQFRQVDVYTKSEAIQVLVMRLSELGLNGFIIHDPADFEEFLENKEYNWDYVDDSLMGLKTVEPHITCYVRIMSRVRKCSLRSAALLMNLRKTIRMILRKP